MFPAYYNYEHSISYKIMSGTSEDSDQPATF